MGDRGNRRDEKRDAGARGLPAVGVAALALAAGFVAGAAVRPRMHGNRVQSNPSGRALEPEDGRNC